MITQQLIKEGLAYAEDNFRNDAAPHLKIDKQLIRSTFDLTDKKVLDFGCGMGGMSLWYATNWNCQLLGVDIDAHHVSIAQQLKNKHNISNARFERRDVLEKPFGENEKFDFVFLNDVAEHIALPILEQILQQLSNSLNPGGKIFITYPPWKSPFASHVVHAVKIPWCQFLPQKQLLKMIERNNIALVGEEESDLVQAYLGLNHLTHKKIMPLVEKAGLKMVFRKTHCALNRLPLMEDVNINFFPFDYLVTKEFLLLERKTA